jgi:sugar phosphate isomerase/epimerase
MRYQDKVGRRRFLNAAAISATTAVVGIAPKVLQSAGKPQKFIAGYAPFTRGTVESYWQACDECAGLGFRHIEVDNSRLKIAQSYIDRIPEYMEQMAKRNLSLVGLGMSGSFTDPANQTQSFDEHMLVGRFVQATGGNYISTMSEPEPDEMPAYVRFAAELGKRLREETGVSIGFHPHSGSARSQVFRRMLDETKPEDFGFILDTGWMRAGGQDPLSALKAYRSRLITLHLKDFDPDLERERRGRLVKGHPVILGRGVIDFPQIIDYLKETEFDRQILGEIGLQGTAEMKAFMVDKLGLRI